MQPQVINRPLEDGRSSDDKDVRVWSLIDMAAGATGILFTRWRPLLDGPLFGAFGPMGMDGSVTPQAEMAAQAWRAGRTRTRTSGSRGRSRATWASCSCRSRTISTSCRAERAAGAGPEVGGSGSANYVQSVQGAYQAFFDSNIQADFVGIDDIGEYPMIYLPYPEMLRKSTADKLRDYVAKGGKLVSEGCPGYFGDGGTAGVVQPNLGLDQLFGARETYVQFTPDLLGKLTLTVRDKQIGGQYFLQEYKLAGGQAAGQYANGHIAAVEHTFGGGKTLLVGTFPGWQLLPQSCAGNARILRRPHGLGRHAAASAVQRPGSESPAAQGGRRYLYLGGQPHANRTEREDLTAFPVRTGGGSLAGLQPSER